MNEYEILITCILGAKGAKVALPDGEQTKERLKRGIVQRVPQHKPEEVKAKPARKKKAK